MSSLFKFATALVLLAAAPAAAQPAAASPGAFDPAQGESVAERLVLCDLASYLKTSPDPNAQIIYVRDNTTNRFELKIPPFVSTGGDFYDEDLERAYRRYRAAGVVSYAQVTEAQDAFTLPMTRAYERASFGEQRFLRSRDRFCRALAKDAPRR